MLKNVDLSEYTDCKDMLVNKKKEGCHKKRPTLYNIYLQIYLDTCEPKTHETNELLNNTYYFIVSSIVANSR
jgi:hypothetical protein